MKNALTFIILLNSIFLMYAMTQAEIDELYQPKIFCGQHLHKAIKTFCQPEFQRILNQKTKKSFDSENELKDESALGQLIGSLYEDEDFQGDAGSNGLDWVTNDLQWSHLNKRNGLGRVTITQLCCKIPCTPQVLTQFCPPFPVRRH